MAACNFLFKKIWKFVIFQGNFKNVSHFGSILAVIFTPTKKVTFWKEGGNFKLFSKSCFQVRRHDGGLKFLIFLPKFKIFEFY
jgi:hypothetical protein